MRTALASIAVVACVLLIGSAAALDTAALRTAFALGVVAATIGYLAGGWADEGRRRG